MSNIQSIERAFSILQIVSNQPSGTRLTDITTEVDLPSSTVARILSTLENLEAVERTPIEGGYRIGPSLYTLTTPPTDWVERVQPLLQKLAKAADESVVLVLPVDDTIYYAAQIQSRHRLQVRDWTGQRAVALHADSAGKVMLAHYAPKQLKRYLSQSLEKLTAQTIVDPVNLRDHLESVHNRGYAWAYNELEDGLSGISAPIFDRDERIIAAVNITGPTFRLPPRHQNQEMTELLLKACRQIQKKIND